MDAPVAFADMVSSFVNLAALLNWPFLTDLRLCLSSLSLFIYISYKIYFLSTVLMGLNLPANEGAGEVSQSEPCSVMILFLAGVNYC